MSLGATRLYSALATDALQLAWPVSALRIQLGANYIYAAAAAALPAFGEFFDHLPVKSWDVVELSAGSQSVVDDAKETPHHINAVLIARDSPVNGQKRRRFRRR